MRIIRSIGSVLVSLALLLSFSACSLGVPMAAKVNGVGIPEEEVTAAIEGFRQNESLNTDESWQLWLNENNQTPDTVRKSVIDSLIDSELVRQEAKKQDIKSDSSAIDSSLNEEKARYATDEDWNSALAESGLTEEQFRNKLESNQLKEALFNRYIEEDTPTDQEVLDLGNAYLPLFDGEKKSSRILFDKAEEELAQDVLNQITSGSLHFEAAVKQYSQDVASVEKNGDVGWSNISELDESHQKALEHMSEGMISDVVSGENGLSIIKCTNIYHAPEQVTSLSQLPEEFVEFLRQKLQEETNQTIELWWDNVRASARIEINEMPEDVSYNIRVEENSTEEEAGSEGDAGLEDVVTVALRQVVDGFPNLLKNE